MNTPLRSLLVALVLSCGGKSPDLAQPQPAPSEVQPVVAGAEAEAPAGEVALPSEAPAPEVAPVPTPASAPEAIMIAKDVGFDTPESVYFDAASDMYFVSNIGGAPSAKDGNGFITRLRPDGTVEALKWIDGSAKKTPLHAPKGMTVVKGVLYVADIDTVRMFDVKTGKSKGNVAVKGATFLNDVASDEAGNVFVSDSGVTIDEKGMAETGTDAIYKIQKGKAKAVAKTKELGKPNGVFALGSAVWVNTFGTGEVYQLDEKGGRANVTKVAGALDGLFAVDGVWYTTSWEQNAVLRSGADGAWIPVLTGLKSPADATYDSKRDAIVIPLFGENVVIAFKRPM